MDGVSGWSGLFSLFWVQSGGVVGGWMGFALWLLLFFYLLLLSSSSLSSSSSNSESRSKLYRCPLSSRPPWIYWLFLALPSVVAGLG